MRGSLDYDVRPRYEPEAKRGQRDTKASLFNGELGSKIMKRRPVSPSGFGPSMASCFLGCRFPCRRQRLKARRPQQEIVYVSNHTYCGETGEWLLNPSRRIALRLVQSSRGPSLAIDPFSSRMSACLQYTVRGSIVPSTSHPRISSK